MLMEKVSQRIYSKYPFLAYFMSSDRKYIRLKIADSIDRS
jgi:hypothetical protein